MSLAASRTTFRATVARVTVLSALATLFASQTLHAQIFAKGPEFQINVRTTGSQHTPNLDLDANGDFVVTWSSVQDGSGSSVTARRFTAAGFARGGEIQVNTYTVGDQSHSDVAVSSGGDFVVVWSSTGQDGGVQGVFARRFDSTGFPQAAEFQVNTHTTGLQDYPDVDMDEAGNFVVAWHSNLQDGDSYGVFAQRFDSSGAAQAGEFRISVLTASVQATPVIAFDADGAFVIAFLSFFQDGGSGGIFARRFDATGTAQATEFQVNSYTPGSQRYPAITSSGVGEFVVAWGSQSQDGSSYGVFVRRLDAAGEPQAVELQVNTYTTGDQLVPAVASSDDGDFVVSWQSRAQYDGGEYTGIFARAFNSAGEAQTAEMQVSTYTVFNQKSPTVGMDSAGRFVVAWFDYHDGSSTGIFAQRFGPIAALDVDANGSTTALGDGVIVLRFLFGFTDQALVGSAVDDAKCTRCDAAAIHTYLQGVTGLDADGSGGLSALSDGMLVLRFLFGSTDAELTAGAVDAANCTRCDAVEIEEHLQTMI